MAEQKSLLPHKIRNLITALSMGVGLLLLLSLSLLLWVQPAQAEAGVIDSGQSESPTPPGRIGADEVWRSLLMQAGAPITLNIDALPPGKGVKIVFTTVVTDPFTDQNAQVQNQGVISGSNLAAEVFTDDPDTATINDPTITNISLKADLGITKTHEPAGAAIVPGTIITYSLVVTNAGPLAVFGGRITDTFDSSILSGIGWSCNGSVGTACTANGTGTIADVITVPVNGILTYTVAATVSAGATGSLVNVASVGVQPGFTDPVAGNNLALDIAALTPQADLGISKVGNPETVIAGKALTYTVVVTNFGPSDATGVVVTDTLPGGVAFSSTTGCAEDPNGVTICTLGAITAGGSSQYQIGVTVDPDTTGSILNAVTVGAAATDPGPTSNNASATTTVNAVSDLEIDKVVNAAQANPGQPITYTVTFTNNGPSAATGVILTDAVPTELSGVGVISSGVSLTSISGDAWSVADLNPGQGGILTITGFVTTNLTSKVTFTNTALITSATDITPANNSSRVGVGVPEAQVEIGKFVNNATPGPGETITYTIVITNNGPDNATGLVVSDTLPVSVTHQSDTASSGSYDESSGVWSGLGDLTGGNRHLLTITVTVTDVADILGQSVANTAAISQVNEIDNPTNNSDTATITVLGADLEVGKQVSDNSPTTGDTIVYTVVVTNTGPDATTGVAVSDTLPISFTLTTSKATQGVYNSGTGLWAVGDLGNGAAETLRLTGTLAASAIGQTITNVATISANDLADLETGNNTATATLRVPESELDITKFVFLPAAPTTPVKNGVADGGDLITYTIGITNNGPDALPAGTVITDRLPDGLTFIGAVPVPNVGSVDTTNLPEIRWTLDALGTTFPTNIRGLVINAVIDPGQGGAQLVNRTAISRTVQDDSNLFNNSDVVTVTVRGADVEIAKTVSNTTPDESEVLTYTITITNNGPDTATNVVITESLPSGITYGGLAAGSPSQGSFAPGLPGVWSGLSLTNGVSETLVFTAAVDNGAAGQTLVNTAAISSSDVEDGDPGNNSASASVTVKANDVEIDKQVNNGAPLEGQIITYTIVISNAGPDAAGQVVISDSIPTGLGYVAGTIAGGDSRTVANLPQLVWTINSLAVNTPVTLTYAVSPTAGTTGQTIVNTAVISGNVLGETNLSNNQDSASITVSDVDLNITKSAQQQAVNNGPAAITYTLTVSNPSTTTATGVVVSDTLPGGLNFVSASSLAYDDATGVWNVGSVSAQSSVSLSIVVTTSLAAGTTITNTAEITAADQIDLNSANNVAVESLTLESAGSNFYFPLILKDFNVFPDLVVESITATGNNVTVVIRNQGNAPVEDAFWVDVYLNPTTIPTTVNQRWNDVGSQGLTWGVQGAALPIRVNDSLTLTVNDAYYFGNLSQVTFPLDSGTIIYAQVDSVDQTTTYGGVLEDHEVAGASYNNISGPVLATGSGNSRAQLAQPQPAPPAGEDLPAR